MGKQQHSRILWFKYNSVTHWTHGPPSPLQKSNHTRHVYNCSHNIVFSHLEWHFCQNMTQTLCFGAWTNAIWRMLTFNKLIDVILNVAVLLGVWPDHSLKQVGVDAVFWAGAFETGGGFCVVGFCCAPTATQCTRIQSCTALIVFQCGLNNW